ncbi:MAG: DNA mismatch repair protein MutS [Clostridia bacterium]|nr:DNA mismatch repair protein MutS [Clostridia bacterium]
MANLSPMMQQYFAVKEKYPDTLVFFRVGDFYEMFFDDAVTASRELELTLTGKECGLEERAPMAGVPHHAVDSYVSRLIGKGYRVAICEQLEDPALAKGLVQRDVVRIVTPGTLTDTSVIGERNNNFLCSVFISPRLLGLAWCDVSTGEFYAQTMKNSEADLKSAMGAIHPGEIITQDAGALQGIAPVPPLSYSPASFSLAKAKELLCAHFSVGSLTALGLDSKMNPAAQAAGALMGYLNETQKNALSHITRLRIVEKDDTMPLDDATRRSLELTETIRGKTVRGSLLGVLDNTVTAMGGRQLRSWVERPLLVADRIRSRLAAVSALVRSPIACAALTESLKNVYDMERLLSKVSYHSLNARDCLSLGRSLKQAPDILAMLSTLEDGALRDTAALIDPCPELCSLIENAVNPEAPLIITEGNIIREGYSAELDELRRFSTDGKQMLLDLETRERERTGIKNLKILFNRVFGYYIEVTKSNYALVPDNYRRRQTLANAERFTTDELQALESRLTGTQEKAMKLESELFDGIRQSVADQIVRLQNTAEGYKTLDALLSLAKAASENHYTCPEITDDGVLEIADGRHPVVEKMMPEQSFVPNDTFMDGDDHRMHIITGPNMAGKSTYMRQVALITLMAHMGSFVPASRARVPLTDCVYTRVGASDDLAGGQSTFMVEMSEMAYILRSATSRSLVILDEIGRGTSTFDGLAIAWAAVEFLSDKKKSGARTLFATHYHELSELEGHQDGVVNFCVAVKEMGEEVVFLRKIRPGGADKSFGIYVARLAGVPKAVVARAQEIEARLEVTHEVSGSLGQNILTAGKKESRQQVDLLGYSQTEFVEEVRALDVLAMTPMDALNKLFLLKEKALKL